MARELRRKDQLWRGTAKNGTAAARLGAAKFGTAAALLRKDVISGGTAWYAAV